MATPALRARLSTPADAVQVLYTDAPEPHAPDVVLKEIPVETVTVPADAEWASGGDRLVEITLADSEIAPKRRFGLRTLMAGQATSAVSDLGFVPAQLTDAAGVPLFAADGSPLIPAPTPSVPGQLRDADGEPLSDAVGNPLFTSP